jgi:hypothetical protein
MRLVVSPHAEGGKEGYDVRVDLLNTTKQDITLRAGWPYDTDKGDVKDYIEAATSIEAYPALAPWLGQVMAGHRTSPEPEHVLKAGKVLSVSWHADGRRLKNRVTDPLAVANPEFLFPGLYSVHATLLISRAERALFLRSNEQLVPIGGSRELPKHTCGPLWWTDEKTKTAALGLGSLHKVVPGDRFLIHTGMIGITWTLTITKVEAGHSTGGLEPSRVNPAPAFPRWGAFAALIPQK